MTNRQIFEKLNDIEDPALELDKKIENNSFNKTRRRKKLKTKGKATGEIALTQNTGRVANKETLYDKMSRKQEEKVEEQIKFQSIDGIYINVIFEGKEYDFSRLMFDKTNGSDKNSSRIINKIREMKNKDKYSGSLYEYVTELSKKG